MVNSVNLGENQNNKDEIDNNNLVAQSADNVKKHVSVTIELGEINPLEQEFLDAMDTTIIGQDKAKKEIARLLKNSILDTQTKEGPLGVLFFSGPTGVGKTEIIKSISQHLMGIKHHFTKINCEQYQQAHTVQNLLGSPKSFVGYSDKTPLDPSLVEGFYESAKKMGKIHNSIKHIQGFNIILFDEIEKAHADVRQALLGLLDEGRIDFSNGTIGNYTNSIIIFTSNIGQVKAEKDNDNQSIGFIPDSNNNSNEYEIIKEAIKQEFSPEFRGRIHKFINFDHLNDEVINKIISLQLVKINKHYQDYFQQLNLSITLNNDLVEKIKEKGFCENSGARGFVRTFEKYIKNNLIDLFSSDSFHDYFHIKGKIEIQMGFNKNGKVNFTINGLDEKYTKVPDNTNIQTLPKPGINLDVLEKSNILVREYLFLKSEQLLDPYIDFHNELATIENELKAIGFTITDINKLRNTTYCQVLSDITNTGSFNLVEYGDNLFNPLSNRVIYTYVTNITLNFIENCGLDNSMKYIYKLVNKINQNLCEKYLDNGEMNKSQESQILYFIGKVYAEKYDVNIDFDSGINE